MPKYHSHGEGILYRNRRSRPEAVESYCELKLDDTTETTRGYKAMPYHIPYRALVARDCSNLMLAGRCISGDFYPHASYRVMGNMAATGEAAGYAAAICSKDAIAPRNFDGKLASEFMAKQGYEI